MTNKLLSVFLLVSSLLTLTRLDALGASLTLNGTVQSDGRQPLRVIKLRIPTLNFDKQIELPISGKIRATVSSTRRTHILCELSAPGFEPKRLTVPIKNGEGYIGSVHMKPYVEIGSVSVTKTGTGTAFVDFWLTSLSDQPLLFESVTVSATTISSEPCFDSSPQLTFSFGRMAITTSQRPGEVIAEYALRIQQPGENSDTEALQVDGLLYQDPCGGKLLKLVAPYSFTLTENDKSLPRKFRIEVPLSMIIRPGEVVYPDWKNAVVSLSMRGRGMISATPD